MPAIKSVGVMILFNWSFSFAAAPANQNKTTEKTASESYAGLKSMNGIKLDDYLGFERNWHFVTVRFRRDTNEMRLTYANDIAWRALQKSAVTYPKGAVFAKIGIATQEDPVFASSAVPSGARRYQFMVRDLEQYKATDGWGYALFDRDGLTLPEEPMQTSQACAACHRLAGERGFVFSKEMIGSPFVLHAPDRIVLKKNGIVFSDVDIAALPSEVRVIVPKNTAKVRVLQGELRSRLFQGTLDEIRPVLAIESARSSLPTLLLSEDGRRYSLVFAEPNTECTGKSTGMKGVANIFFKDNEKYEVRFCQPL